MDHDRNCFRHEVTLGHIQEPGIRACLAPTILDEKIAGTVLIARKTCHMHQVVVGRGIILKLLLPALLGDELFISGSDKDILPF